MSQLFRNANISMGKRSVFLIPALKAFLKVSYEQSMMMMMMMMKL